MCRRGLKINAGKSKMMDWSVNQIHMRKCCNKVVSGRRVVGAIVSLVNVVIVCACSYVW